MSLLAAHKRRLEDEIISAKEKICQLKESQFPDLALLNQLKDKVERNWQLITMIDQHIGSGSDCRYKPQV